MNKELVLSEIDRLIDANDKSADWYRTESRFVEADERAMYQEARSIHKATVHDLQQLRKVVENA